MGSIARRQDDKGFHDFGPLRIGFSNHSNLGNGRVFHQSVFNFERPNPIGRAGDDVIRPGDEPKVAVFVGISAVTR